MNGVVSGGWEFVWAAYAVSAVVLAGYCARVINEFFKELFKARGSQERGAKGMGL
jgi:heme exporter protein D